MILLLITMTMTMLSPAGISDLFQLAESCEQVERAAKLITTDSLLFDIPCISPLQASDFRRIPISSAYGTRLHPILHEYKHHSGVDLPGQFGESVYATANGIVSKVSEDAITGQYIKIRHKYDFETLYGHLSRQAVSAGDTVRIGSVIGFVGSTGRSTGPHLHYGLTKKHRQLNPLPFCYLYLDWKMAQVSNK